MLHKAINIITENNPRATVELAVGYNVNEDWLLVAR
jgi:hypothetical protein